MSQPCLLPEIVLFGMAGIGYYGSFSFKYDACRRYSVGLEYLKEVFTDLWKQSLIYSHPVTPTFLNPAFLL